MRVLIGSTWAALSIILIDIGMYHFLKYIMLIQNDLRTGSSKVP